jgi:predicted permease
MADLRLALRTLLRSPGFSLVAILSLALGIGANTAIFSLVDRLLLRPMAVSQPGRLVVLHSDQRLIGSSTSDNHETTFSYPMYRDLRRRSTGFEGVFARAGRVVSLATGQDSEIGRVDMLSGNAFKTLGLKPAMGRFFGEEEDGKPGEHPVAVATHAFWRDRLGGNSGAIGATVRINGTPFRIIGVLPREFTGLLVGESPDVMVPLAMQKQVAPQWDGFENRRMMFLNVFARLDKGVELLRAEAETKVLFRQLLESEAAEIKFNSPERRKEFLSANISLKPAGRGIESSDAEQMRVALFALLGMVGLVLLIACANVANLLIARAANRRREIAIRASIGASRGAIVRQLMVESLIIAGAAGVAGVLIASWVMDALLAYIPESGPSLAALEFQPDRRVLLFTTLLSFGTAFLFGLLPAWQSARTDILSALKGQSGGQTGGAAHAGVRKAMVMGQVALATVLLVTAGLFARSLGNLLSVHPGYRTENVMSVSLDPRLNGYNEARGRALYEQMEERFAHLPGVIAVGSANPGPLSGSNRSGNITIEGLGEQTGCAHHGVSAGFFSAMGVPMLAGREFTEADKAGAQRVVVVNEAFARRYFGNESPLGRLMMFGSSNLPLSRAVLTVKDPPPAMEIVGVVSNYKHGSLREEPKPAAFVPLPQDSFDGRTFYVRTANAQPEVARQMRDAVRAIDSSLSLFRMRALELQAADSVFSERLVTMLASSFGVLATLLAALGVYGVIAFMVARRTAEIGIRMALGASRGAVLWLVLHEMAWVTVAGMAAGLALAIVGSRVLESILYGIRGNDAIAFAGATGAIAFVAVLAAFVPARRAARVEPLSALRYE